MSRFLPNSVTVSLPLPRFTDAGKPQITQTFSVGMETKCFYVEIERAEVGAAGGGQHTAEDGDWSLCPTTSFSRLR